MIESFYRENYRIVYGYLLSLCGDPTQAEELTADTFCRAVEKVDTYDARFKPSTWLCTIARNLFLNECRRRKKLTGLESAEYMEAPSAEAVVMEREQLAALWCRLQSFTYEPRQVFLMRLEGMAFREIGLALGKTENWARVTYFRVKSKLLEEMEGEI